MLACTCILHHLVAQHPELDSYKTEISLCHHHWGMISIQMVFLGWPKSSKKELTKQMSCIGSLANWSSSAKGAAFFGFVRIQASPSCGKPSLLLHFSDRYSVCLLTFTIACLGQQDGSWQSSSITSTTSINCTSSVTTNMNTSLGDKNLTGLHHIWRDGLSMATCQVHRGPGSLAVAISRDSMSFAQLCRTRSHLERSGPPRLPRFTPLQRSSSQHSQTGVCRECQGG